MFFLMMFRRTPVHSRHLQLVLALWAGLLATGTVLAQQAELTVVLPPGSDGALLEVEHVAGLSAPLHGQLLPVTGGFFYQPDASFWQVGQDVAHLHLSRPESTVRVRWVVGITDFDGPVAAMDDPGYGRWQPWQLESPPENPIEIVEGIVADEAYAMTVETGVAQPRMVVSPGDPAGSGGSSSTTSDMVVVIDDIGFAHGRLSPADTVTFYRLSENFGMVAELELRWSAEQTAWQVRPISPLDSGAPWSSLTTGYNALRMVRWTSGQLAGTDLMIDGLPVAGIVTQPHTLAVAEQHELLVSSLEDEASGLILTFEDPTVRRSHQVAEGAFRTFYDGFDAGPSPSWSQLGVTGALTTQPQDLPGQGQRLAIELAELAAGQTSYLERLPSPSLEPVGQGFHLRVDPSVVTLDLGSPLPILAACPQSGLCGALRLRLFQSSGGLELQGLARQDDGSVVLLSQPLGPVPSTIDLRWRRSVAPEVATGWLELWVDGELSGRIDGLSNHAQPLERLRLGVLGAPAGSAGSIAIDDFETWHFD